MHRDKKSKLTLIENLNSIGYSISENLDIPDINSDNKSYCFLIDRKNKKWFLANYREYYADAFDYSDIADYKISYRLSGTKIVKGESFSGSYSEFSNNGTKILDIVDLNNENCEYISFELIYTGKAHEANLCNQFVLFENQRDGEAAMKNHHYMLPSQCIINAKDFENLLFEIMNKNSKNI